MQFTDKWKMKKSLACSYSNNISPGELKMRKLLDQVYPDMTEGKDYENNWRPDWLKNNRTGHNLEFDRYYYKYNLAFEFGGKDHQKPEQIKKDSLKRKIASSFGIVVVYVSPKQIDWLSTINMKDQIHYWKKRYSSSLKSINRLSLPKDDKKKAILNKSASAKKMRVNKNIASEQVMIEVPTFDDQQFISIRFGKNVITLRQNCKLCELKKAILKLEVCNHASAR